jgi:hypothetical protein
MRSLIPLSLILTLFGSCSVQGLKLPFHVQTGNPPSPNNRLGRRANTTIPITNTQNAQYISNITLGGVQVAVLLDTGRYNKSCYSQCHVFTIAQFRSMGEFPGNRSLDYRHGQIGDSGLCCRQGLRFVDSHFTRTKD